MLVEAGALQSRSARLNDRFKAVWTAQQVVSGVFQHFFAENCAPVADFSELQTRVRAISSLPSNSAPISLAISATRRSICSRVNNVVCAIRVRIIASRNSA